MSHHRLPGRAEAVVSKGQDLVAMLWNRFIVHSEHLKQDPDRRAAWDELFAWGEQIPGRAGRFVARCHSIHDVAVRLV